MVKITKVENVALTVDNIDEAREFYGGLFGVTFDPPQDIELPDGMKVKMSLSHAGIELIQQVKPPVYGENLRTLALRVPDLEKTKAEVKRRGIPIIDEFEFDIGHHVKEIICYVRGIRVAFEEHDE